MKRLLTAATVTVCIAAASALSACSSSESPKDKATKAASSLCTDISALKSDNAKLAALDPASATKDQVGDAIDAVKSDWKKIADDSGDLSSAKKDAVSGSVDDLKSSYDDLGGDTTGKQALDQLQPQIQKVKTTAAAASTSLKCP